MREKERGREKKRKKVLKKVDVRVLSESCVDFQSSEKKHPIKENQIFLKISSFLPLTEEIRSIALTVRKTEEEEKQTKSLAAKAPCPRTPDVSSLAY